MNKMLIKVILPTFAIVCAITFVFAQYNSRNLENNEKDITKSSMKNGSNGYYVETSNKDKNNNKDYNIPDLVISIGNRQIEYIVEKDRWDGIDYDREDTFKTILNRTSEAQIPYIEIGQTATIQFKDNPPDKISISDNLIDKRGVLRYNNSGIINIPVKLENGKFSFEIKKHMASYLDSYYIVGKTDIRGFRIIASWGENECEYAFLISTSAI